MLIGILLDSPTKLHRSQTLSLIALNSLCLIPLRNCTALKPDAEALYAVMAWFPYEIAPLSNEKQCQAWSWKLDSPTKLHRSQTQDVIRNNTECLIPLRNCTALKLVIQHRVILESLIPLRNCTALKRYSGLKSSCAGLIPLRNCTALKRSKSLARVWTAWFPYEIAPLSNIHWDKKSGWCAWFPYEIAPLSNALSIHWPCYLLDSPTKLHRSQTCIHIHHLVRSLIPLRNCTALKPVFLVLNHLWAWFPYEIAPLSNHDHPIN